MRLDSEEWVALPHTSSFCTEAMRHLFVGETAAGTSNSLCYFLILVRHPFSSEVQALILCFVYLLFVQLYPMLFSCTMDVMNVCPQ